MNTESLFAIMLVCSGIIIIGLIVENRRLKKLIKKD